MLIVRSLLLVLEVICSILLIGLILLQRSKGGGLGLAFGGGGEGSMFGSRTGNVLTKATIVLGLVFLLNTLVLGMLFTGSSVVGPSELDKELMKDAGGEQPAAVEVDDQFPEGMPDENRPPESPDVGQPQPDGIVAVPEQAQDAPPPVE